MNRLTNHLAAIGLAPTVTKCYTPKLETRQLPHYRVIRYRPAKVNSLWLPSHPGDGIVELDHKQVRFGPRFGTLSEALAVALAENRMELLNRKERTDSPKRWASVAFVEGPSKFATHFAAVVTPLRYLVVPVNAPRGWSPPSLLSAPTWTWRATTAFVDLEWHDEPRYAVHSAVKKNAEYGDDKRIAPIWYIVLACEADPASASVHVEGSLACINQCLRVHVVDETWPLDDATRDELAKGGAQ